MCSKCGRWMEGKKRVVPREICAECSERSNRYREMALRERAAERLLESSTKYLEGMLKLIGLGMPEWAACEGAYSRKAYWRMAGNGVVQRALTKERLTNWGFYDLATAYQSMHVNY